MGFIILGVVAVYLVIRAVVVYRFRSKNKNLSDKELKDLAADLYFDLDDFGWSWKKAVEYRTAVEMLKERETEGTQRIEEGHPEDTEKRRLFLHI